MRDFVRFAPDRCLADAWLLALRLTFFAVVLAAMAPIRALTPAGGAYVNEADYFEPDWQRTFWGDNYTRLLAIKRTYDPAGLFVCHHCVGSDEH
ncbi:MAG TPA: BBE domain-containing protein [Kofleriaceae bacterium]|nr:BBE domain-containing protein [Kofleriaceae bacterium]